VKDATEAVLPGTTITATNEDTGLMRTTVTNGAGAYTISDLPVGRYRLSAELQGFKTATRTGIQLRVADDLGIDFELATGQVSETVNVEASAAPVKTIGGDVSGLVTGEMVRE